VLHSTDGGGGALRTEDIDGSRSHVGVVVGRANDYARAVYGHGSAETVMPPQGGILQSGERYAAGVSLATS